MKKMIKPLCLVIAAGFFVTSAIAAPVVSKKLSFGVGDYIVHTTHVRLTSHPYVHTYAVLAQGTYKNGECQNTHDLASLDGFFGDGSTIGAPNDVFSDKLTPQSCATETFTSDTNVVAKITYKLINNGMEVTAASPTDQDVELD